MKKQPQLRLPPVSLTRAALTLMATAAATLAQPAPMDEETRPAYDSLCLVRVGRGIDADTNFMDSCWKAASIPADLDSTATMARDSILQEPVTIRERVYVRYVDEDAGAEVAYFLGWFVAGLFELGSHRHHGGRRHDPAAHHHSRDAFDSHSDRPSRHRGEHKN